MISYRSTERDKVKVLADQIEDLGHDVWFDKELTGGRSWWDEILSEMRKADVIVLALSPAALKSVPCQRERDYAYALGKHIIPVQISDGIDYDNLPLRIAELQIINYITPNIAAVTQLARALAVAPRNQPLPEPLPEPPPVPIDETRLLRDELRDDDLPRSEQARIFFRLRDLYREADEPEQRKEAMDVLQQLRRHPNLVAVVAEDIDRLLVDSQAIPVTRRPDGPPKPVAQPGTPPAKTVQASVSVEKTAPPSAPAPQAASGGNRTRNIALAIVGMLVMGVGGLIALGSAGSDEPASTPTTAATVNETRSDSASADVEDLLQRGDEADTLADRIDWYSQAVAADPTWNVPYALRGDAYLLNGEWQAAVNDYNQATELEENDLDSFLNRSIALAAFGSDADAALDEADHVIERDATAEAYVWRAMLRLSYGDASAQDIDLALDDIEEALAFDPEFPDAYVVRGLAKLAGGDRDAALADLERSVDLDLRFEGEPSDILTALLMVFRGQLFDLGWNREADAITDYCAVQDISGPDFYNFNAGTETSVANRIEALGGC